jgi:hypothetical protein
MGGLVVDLRGASSKCKRVFDRNRYKISRSILLLPMIVITYNFRIKGWWVAHHYITTVLCGIILTWRDDQCYKQFRGLFIFLSIYICLVQVGALYAAILQLIFFSLCNAVTKRGAFGDYILLVNVNPIWILL